MSGAKRFRLETADLVSPAQIPPGTNTQSTTDKPVVAQKTTASGSTPGSTSVTVSSESTLSLLMIHAMRRMIRRLQAHGMSLRRLQ